MSDVLSVTVESDLPSNAPIGRMIVSEALLRVHQSPADIVPHEHALQTRMCATTVLYERRDASSCLEDVHPKQSGERVLP